VSSETPPAAASRKSKRDRLAAAFSPKQPPAGTFSPLLDCTKTGRELARCDMIALTTEQQPGRTVGWLPHIFLGGSDDNGVQHFRIAWAERE
jgi:hypothetical protein